MSHGLDTLGTIFNDCLIKAEISNELKLTHVTPLFKKENSLRVKNCRPVIVLPSLSKTFEKILHRQICPYVDLFISHSMCDYRKGFSTQQDVIAIYRNIEKHS